MLVCERFQKLSSSASSYFSNLLSGKTHDLQLILPELLLMRLVQKWEIANMMHKDIPQNRQLGVNGRDFAKLGSEGGAEALQGGWGV